MLEHVPSTGTRFYEARFTATAGGEPLWTGMVYGRYEAVDISGSLDQLWFKPTGRIKQLLERKP